MFAAFAADPAITVSARQRYPWNGLVDINFTITGDAGTKYDTSFTAKDMVGNTNIAMRTIRKADGTAAAAMEQLLPGSYIWVWDTVADLPKGFKSNHVRVTGTANISAFPYSVKFNANGGTGTMADESFTYGIAKALTANAFTRTGYTFQGWATSASGAKVYNDKQSVLNLADASGAVVNLYAVWKARLYMVINLSSGASSTSYPISYLDAVPSGGWTDTHKKTRLVLRRIDAGSFKMQGKTTTTLTKSFYIGIFEMTKKQWSLVTGDTFWSASYDTDPRSCSYSEARGSTNGAKWPSSSAVDSSNFIGKLRTRTNKNFDLPTEAQWEYACRAGTTTTYYWGNTINGDYCWYNGNSPMPATERVSSPVGTKKPNAWGLYDMSGNLSELCLDWYGSLAYGTDPKGPSSGTERVGRGGWYMSGDTTHGHPLSELTSSGRVERSSGGFRLCLTLSD